MRAARSIGFEISSRALGAVVAIAFAMSASACRTEPFCLNCGEGGTTLGNWGLLGTFTAAGTTHLVTITPNPDAAVAFYRVRL